MYSEITDELNIKIYLDAGKEWCLTFSPISQSEASISVDIKQEQLSMHFKSLCYAHGLYEFGKSLSEFEAGKTNKAEFINSIENLEIQIEPLNELGDLTASLEYQHISYISNIPRVSKIPLVTYAGKISDCIRVKSDIFEFIRLHKFDVRHYMEISKNG